MLGLHLRARDLAVVAAVHVAALAAGVEIFRIANAMARAIPLLEGTQIHAVLAVGSLEIFGTIALKAVVLRGVQLNASASVDARIRRALTQVGLALWSREKVRIAHALQLPV